MQQLHALEREILVPELVRSVVLAGIGIIRWPTGENAADYRVTVGLDSAIGPIRIGPPVPSILGRPIRHGNIFLYMKDRRRIALNIAPNGELSADGPIERGRDELGWWTDTTPWIPLDIPDHFSLIMKGGSVLIFQSHATREQAEIAYHQHWQHVDKAEIRPPFGRPIRLK